MITFNKKITLQEAAELLKSVGMVYPDTEHNKDMIAKAIGISLKEKQGV